MNDRHMVPKMFVCLHLVLLVLGTQTPAGGKQLFLHTAKRNKLDLLVEQTVQE
jgi:hypothetical protein